MKTILIPLDGSDLAAQAVPYARALAHLTGAEIHLLHVVSDALRQRFIREHPELAWNPGEAPLEGETADERMYDVLREHGINYCRGIAEPLREAGIAVELHVDIGDPTDVILEMTVKLAVDLVVMVTHGYSGLRRWALGSVTERVVRGATVPVFVIRAQKIPSDERLDFKEILLTLDGSPVSEQAIPLAQLLAEKAGGEIVLMQAVLPRFEFLSTLTMGGAPASVASEGEDEMASNDEYQEAVQNLQHHAAQLQDAGLKVRTQVSSGYPAEKIIEAATAFQADVIVMATHGYSGLRRWALGSVADKVLHATDIPLLLVHVRQP